MIVNENYQINYQQLRTKQDILCKETTLLVILKGSLFITIEEVTDQVSAGELFVMNTGERVLLNVGLEQSCIYLELRINSVFFATQFPAFFYTRFDCRPIQNEHGKMPEIAALRRQIAELCLVEFSDDPSKKLKITLFLTQIILSLVHHFQKEDVIDYHPSDNQKLREILEYIEAHYHEGILLSDAADYFFMSESSLSKFFKKETGEYFSHYVRTICVKHSLSELLYTKKSIEQIALDNGFSNSKTYRQHFKKIFSDSPTQYRSAHLVQTKAPEKIKQVTETSALQIKEILVPLYSFIQTGLEESRPSELSLKTKKLHITAEQSEADHLKKDVIIHVGSWEALASRKIQNEILDIKKQMGIKYISIQSLFTQIPLTVQIHQEAAMNSFPAFEEWDYILGFLESAQLALFFQVSLVEFKQLDERVKDICRKFFRHVQNKFGTKMTEKWKINCLFKEQNLAEYYPEFLEVKKRFLALSPKIAVGAEFFIADPFFEQQQPEQTQFFCEMIATKCDFLSFSAEPNYVFQNLDNPFPNLKNYHQYVLNKTLRIKHILKEYEIKLPLYLTEWNTLTGMTRNSNGTFFRGAIILKDLLLLDTLVAGFGFWLNIELYEKQTQERPLKNDGLELFHFYSGKRPTYFCLWLARRMTGKILAQGEDYLLTSVDGKYQLLLFNANYFDPHLSSEEAFLESQAVTFEIELAAIKPAHYQIKQIDFNRHNGALFYTYEEFRNAEALDLETQKYVVESTRPKIKVFDTQIEHLFNYYVTLDTNGIMLLELTPTV
ncbi:helix-turn-helix domain-containing protein [Enterococcus plantarum]|uniref:helix-turn-helix domain-containing protein n=1 Tax=Enterococcus plantarum TaxID=1077675 RepID=UPI001A8C0E95|nr:helix-turn-helix domain-containing protein [Enterococcus plantarum]MBO0424089.1 helix-turn-helix domain-containing protein [Enterococcus plantarum]